MKRNWKKLAFLVCLMFLVLSCRRSKASGPMDGQIIDGSILTDNDSASDTRDLIPENPFDGEIVPYGIYLSNGSSSIKNEGNGIVYITGGTYCYRISDTVYVKLYLERLSNGSWSSVQTHSHTEYGNHYAYTGVSFSVKKGYYYRVRGYHYAQKGSTLESVFTCTNALFIK